MDPRIPSTCLHTSGPRFSRTVYGVLSARPQPRRAAFLSTLLPSPFLISTSTGIIGTPRPENLPFLLVSGSCTHTIPGMVLFLGSGEEKRLTDDRFPRIAR